MNIVYIVNRWLDTVRRRQELSYADHSSAPLFGVYLAAGHAAADVHHDSFAIVE